VNNRDRSIQIPLLALLGICAGLFVLGPVDATAAQPVQEVEEQIEKTERILEHVREVIAEVGSPDAAEAMEFAQRLQADAQDAAAGEEWQRAAKLTQRARERALRAMSAGPPRTDREDAVRRELEETDQLLRRRRDRIRPGGKPGRRFEMTRRSQERAWQHFRERRLRNALKQTLEARDRERRGTGPRARGSRAHRGQRERLEQMTRRLGDAIVRAESMLNGSNGRARGQLEIAQAALKAAQHALQDADWDLAQRSLHQGRSALGEVLRVTAEDLKTEEFDALLGDARMRLAELTEVAEEEERTNRRLIAARENLERAREAYSDNRRRQAILQIHRALRLLDHIDEDTEL
jgi:hypothetical protein